MHYSVGPATLIYGGISLGQVTSCSFRIRYANKFSILTQFDDWFNYEKDWYFE